MTNPKYNVHITYQPSVVSGWQNVSINGATYSVKKYDGNYYIASMPEMRLYATGSYYDTALDNLLLLVGSASDGNYPLSSQGKW